MSAVVRAPRAAPAGRGRPRPAPEAGVTSEEPAAGAVAAAEQTERPAASEGVAGGVEQLAWALDEFVHTVREVGNLVVLRTVPGGARVVAAAIDRARIAPIVGTVAGNDTVLATTRSAFAGGVMARYLRAVARDRPGRDPETPTASRRRPEKGMT